MKSLIIGAGQIGRALQKIIARKYPVSIRDTAPMKANDITFLHISFPYSAVFVQEVRRYIAEYKPRLTIIHSTVLPGTTALCGEHVVYSPERGRHPKLDQEMTIYEKFVASEDPEDLKLAEGFFGGLNWQTITYPDTLTLEALKLISNAHMGLEIAWRQEVARWGIDPAIYEQWEETYFRGYQYLGQKNIVRPRMNPGPIGGHCILPSIEILKKGCPSELLDAIQVINERTQRKEESAQNGNVVNGTAQVSLIR